MTAESRRITSDCGILNDGGGLGRRVTRPGDIPPMSKKRRLSGFLRGACRRFLSLKGNPREISLGFALGLFVGMLPFVISQTVTAVFIASLCKWNKIAAAAGVVITNPVTAPFFYAMTFKVGAAVMPETSSRLVMPAAFSVDAVMALLKNGPEILWILTVGGVVTGIPISLAGYILAYRLVLIYRKRRSDQSER